MAKFGMEYIRKWKADFITLKHSGPFTFWVIHTKQTKTVYYGIYSQSTSDQIRGGYFLIRQMPISIQRFLAEIEENFPLHDARQSRMVSLPYQLSTNIFYLVNLQRSTAVYRFWMAVMITRAALCKIAFDMHASIWIENAAIPDLSSQQQQQKQIPH